MVSLLCEVFIALANTMNAESFPVLFKYTELMPSVSFSMYLIGTLCTKSFYTLLKYIGLLPSINSFIYFTIMLCTKKKNIVY